MTFDRTKADLGREAMAAAALISELASDDAQLVHDMIEGETDIFEAIEAALSEIWECEVLAVGLKSHIDEMSERLSMVKNRADRVRGMIDQAMQMAEIEKHKFTTATVSQKKVHPKAIVSDESQIPSRFFKPQPPKLDQKELLSALKDGDVPGASLSNGGTTIQIRKL